MNTIWENTQKRLLHYLHSGRVHPALLLTGADAETKFKVARTMAKFLLCKTRTVRGPCGECSPCRRVEKDLHPDVIQLKEEGEDTIKIDSVREVCHQMAIAPIEDGAKVCLVDECHRLNQASSNAFLKTLEEPGKDRYFILMTSQPGSLLPTILSRCLEFSFKPIEAFQPPEAVERFSAILRDLLKTANVRGALDELSEKEDCLEFLKFLQRQFRDAVVAEPSVAELKGSSPFSLLSGFEGALVLEGRLRSNANFGLLLESYLKQNFAEVT